MEIQRQGASYVLIFAIGEDLISTLTAFAQQEEIAAASISAIGALRDFELGYYYLDRKEYGRKKFKEIAELLSCSGNLAMREEKSFAHLHASMGRDDFSVIGGHLFSGVVAVTVEMIIVPFPVGMGRTFDKRTGLYLLSSRSGKTL